MLIETPTQGLLRSLCRPPLTLLAAALALGTGRPLRADAALQEVGFQEASASTTEPQPPPFRFVPAPGTIGVALPREERLVYSAYLDLSLVSANVGTVTQTCTVAEQAAPLIVAQPSASAGEAASIKLYAEGSYLWYSLESTLETRILPQEWPRLFYKQESKSSKTTRRREVMLGNKDGAPTASYRGDTKKGAPEGMRIWRPEQVRAVPEGTIDMLTAVFMARTLVREKADSLTFPLIDSTRIWRLVLRRGREERVETGAGTFDALEVVLDPEPFPGEVMADKAKQFAGVFGIHGTIHLWVEKRTGVAVRIQGDLPINDGMITLGVDVVLDSFAGTPAEFAPLE